MLASEFVNTIVFGMLKGTEDGCTQMSNIYKNNFFLIPRIYCKDGFNISIQVSKGSYCASENGVRTFGTDWKLVEWGYPSEEIDPEKYNADGYAYEANIDTTKTVGGYVEIELIDALLQEHGGIDLQATLTNSMGSMYSIE